MPTEQLGIWGSLGQSAYGKKLQSGLMADVGFYKPKGGARYSFLGGRAGWQGATASKWAFTKALGGTAFKALPLVGNVAWIYGGYKEGGVTGAIGAAAEGLAFTAGFEAISTAVGAVGGLPVVLGAAAAAGAGYAGYAFGEAGQRHEKRIREVEMGAEVVDRFGAISTLRQRSLMALQNSHINGRMAIGNEALLLHSSF